jgi:hypothetical protein
VGENCAYSCLKGKCSCAGCVSWRPQNSVGTEFRRTFLLPYFKTSVGIGIIFRGIHRNSEKRNLTEFRDIPRYSMYGLPNFDAALAWYMLA